MSAADDDRSSEPLPGFEGPEKNLEIDFVPDQGPARGLREVTRAQWDVILEAAKCTILGSMSNDKCDSYILSESSLFVYSHKVILKTCGTTTLLRCLDPLKAATESLGMSIEWLAYTRKDFIFPSVQKFPHRAPNEETTYLKERFPAGHAFVMGPLTGDHWFVFVADYLDRPTTECADRTLDMMMFGIDEDVAKLFVKDRARFPADTDVTKAAGIHTLLPGSTIQEFCFDPCGYSMNGLLFDAYWTIHITPESHCSYASFETNVRMTNFTPLIRAVLAIFRPRKFTMTLFADERGLRAVRESPFAQVLTVPLVDTTSPAVIGPCVLVSEPGGGSYVSYPPAGDKGAAGAGAGSGRAGPGAREAFPVVAVSEGGGELLSPSPASSLDSPTSVASAPVGGGSGTGGGGLVALRKQASTSRLLGGAPIGSGGSGLAAYVMADKCHTEFVGEYHSILGNFRLVGNGSNGEGGAPGNRTATPRTLAGSNASETAATVLPAAASATLALPRLKYVVERELHKSTGKLRTESF